ncbi:MAG: hypothetical protein CBB69_013430 [Phycisphaera sp. TMED9]|nr:MAG: hypothetical protein CBB69_013430 [Phycisphaera sp. TMED9]
MLDTENMSRSSYAYITSAFLISAAAASPAPADVLTVNLDGSGDFTSIQAAIDSADNGDLILVSPGVYTEPSEHVIDLVGKAIVVSAVGTAQETIIDGEGIRRGIFCGSGETASTVIEGFTIRDCFPTWYDWNKNGAIDFWEYFGGGCWNRDGSSPTIRNCIFIENRAEYGGAIYNGDENGVASNPHLEGCQFLDNGLAQGLGGAIYNMSSRPTILNCALVGNRSYFGGGVLNFNGSDPILTGCVFLSNNAISDGGGMYNDASEPRLTGCEFIENTASDEGGAIFNADPSSSANIPVFEECLFRGNRASAEGGAMHNFSVSPTITNCEFSENVATEGGAIHSWNGSTPAIGSSTICDNTPDQISGPFSDQGSNSISDTCDVACPTDLDGDGTTGGGDLGLVFVEWGRCRSCPADFNDDGMVNGIDLGILFVEWGPCF